MARSDTLMGLLLLGAALTLTTLIDGAQPANRASPLDRLVAALQLSDLALFTESRYTRHLSQADLHSAFQDHPGALEHFPSGSLAGPPAHLANAPSDP